MNYNTIQYNTPLTQLFMDTRVLNCLIISNLSKDLGEKMPPGNTTNLKSSGSPSSLVDRLLWSGNVSLGLPQVLTRPTTASTVTEIVAGVVHNIPNSCQHSSDCVGLALKLSEISFCL